MPTAITQYISAQPTDRHSILTAIHTIIIEQDKTVVPIVELMMGKEMIVYKAKGSMKYALAGVSKHMSLHLLPIYGSPTLWAKYKALLPNVVFQKGCINFKTEDEIPLKIITQLIADCSTIDLLKIREDYLQEKKLKAKEMKAKK